MNLADPKPEISKTGWNATCPLHGAHKIAQREKPVYCRKKVLRKGQKAICDRELVDVFMNATTLPARKEDAP